LDTSHIDGIITNDGDTVCDDVNDDDDDNAEPDFQQIPHKDTPEINPIFVYPSINDAEYLPQLEIWNEAFV
jgi:hypothetical protein